MITLSLKYPDTEGLLNIDNWILSELLWQLDDESLNTKIKCPLFTIVCLFLCLLNGEVTYAQNEVKQDTNYRVGNPDDVPGVKEIIYHWGTCSHMHTTEDLSNLPPMSKSKLDSVISAVQILQKERERIWNIQIEKNKKLKDSLKVIQDSAKVATDSINNILENDTLNRSW